MAVTYNQLTEGFNLLPADDPAVTAATDRFFEKAKIADPHLTRARWEADQAGPYIYAIQQLKKRQKCRRDRP
ncbi:MAG: hypothetical protein LRZ85_07810 [Alphaproteobacteria bacterium]|nr:hypothetical protein [Alphaproteobacteria bacterium]